MDFEPNAEQQMLIDQVRRYVREEILPLEARMDPDASELDPADHARMARAYDVGDALHPNDAGFRVMADAIDLSLFR